MTRFIACCFGKYYMDKLKKLFITNDSPDEGNGLNLVHRIQGFFTFGKEEILE